MSFNNDFWAWFNFCVRGLDLFRHGFCCEEGGTTTRPSLERLERHPWKFRPPTFWQNNTWFFMESITFLTTKKTFSPDAAPPWHSNPTKRNTATRAPSRRWDFGFINSWIGLVCCVSPEVGWEARRYKPLRGVILPSSKKSSPAISILHRGNGAEFVFRWYEILYTPKHRRTNQPERRQILSRSNKSSGEKSSPAGNRTRVARVKVGYLKPLDHWGRVVVLIDVSCLKTPWWWWPWL